MLDGKIVREAILTVVLIGAVLLLFWQNTQLSDENRQLSIQNALLQTSKGADNKALGVREEGRAAATENAEKKINEIENLAKSADGLSDDELLTHLKRLCKEDGICLIRTPKRSAP